MKMSEMNWMRQTVLEAHGGAQSLLRAWGREGVGGGGPGVLCPCTGCCAPAASFIWNPELFVPWSSDLSRKVRNRESYVKYLKCGHWQLFQTFKTSHAPENPSAGSVQAGPRASIHLWPSVTSRPHAFASFNSDFYLLELNKSKGHCTTKITLIPVAITFHSSFSSCFLGLSP